MFSLSISNIAWTGEQDSAMYARLKQEGFSGLEIAPTRIFPQQPYRQLTQAAAFAEELREKYDLTVCSMQSIWFGREEKLFDSEEERRALLDYTCQAIDFAAAAGCKNLVFGSPKNRIMQEESQWPLALSFFRSLGESAKRAGVVVALEPNPALYGTNFINTTRQAFDFVREVGQKGIAVNLDFGTILANGETLDAVVEHLPLVHHIHISEPNLLPLQQRPQHRELAQLLRQGRYSGYVSLEMKNPGSLSEVLASIAYLQAVFA